MSDNEGEGTEAEPAEGKATAEPEPLWIRYAARGAFTAWTVVFVVGAVALYYGKADKFGAFGDAFGVVTGLLTALALLASVRSISLQRDELAATRQEMALQRQEMAEQRGVMEASRQVAESQLSEMQRSRDVARQQLGVAQGQLDVSRLSNQSTLLGQEIALEALVRAATEAVADREETVLAILSAHVTKQAKDHATEVFRRVLAEGTTGLLGVDDIAEATLAPLRNLARAVDSLRRVEALRQEHFD